jgi:hypothetical protein
MATKSKKAPVVIVKAPKIVTAWNGVCTTSAKSENEIVKAIENLSATLILESRLSVTDQKKFIKGLEDSGRVSSFIKSSHAPALPTWSKLRALHKDFVALPIAKQLSTASASYDLLGSGKGEQFKSLEILTKEIATVRKNKAEKSKANATKPAKEGKKSATMADTLRAAIALVNSISDGVEDEVYDLLLELAEVAALKVGVDA